MTGMPRSGTTGVGSVLASAPRAAYFYEPLNPLSGLHSVDDYFLFAGPSGPDTTLTRQLNQVFGLDLRLRSGIWRSDPAWRRAVKTVTGSRSRVSGVRCRLDPTLRTVVWKDPFASFLVPLLRERLGLPAVITVRSPEAAAASFKRLGWGFDLDRVRRHLAELTPGAAYLDASVPWERSTESSAMNGALLWRLIYGYLDLTLPAGTALDRDVFWANSRALIGSPLETYEQMFATVGLRFEEATREEIVRLYRDEGTAEPSSARAHDRHRNVNEANSYWNRTLTLPEQADVAAVTRDVRERVERRIGSLG
ncbi:hypothetical protein [Nocardioides sp.]|uniref:hypothetical protein n=1 Tax=Nocardioides sp. TaxID=35761 RepID=UPI00286CBDBD|nr:hypothetical protein [Nocardioides sp.]